ncbi:hypothetical protein ACFLTZ_03530 [Chloroflexota bacterium]
MKVSHLYAGQDGESHFDEIDIPLKDMWDYSQQSEIMKATTIFFREKSADYNRDWHNASHRQFVIILEGIMEIEIGDGTRRQFGPGEVFLAEDTTGRGHITRSVGNQLRKYVFITLD